MRKKLLMLFVMISTILCAFGCAKDPYEKMTLTTNSPSAVQLYIKDVGNNGSAVYEYPTHSFDVKVDNIGSGISPAITLSGGQGIVTCETIYRGNGVTTVNVTPISPEKTGKFTLLVKTLEGNKSFSVDFNVDLKINNFFLEKDRLKVISKGQSIDLNDLDKYITFDPINTTEKNIKFEVVTPVSGVIENYPDNAYIYNNDALGSSNVYAKIDENNILTTYTDAVYPLRVVSTDVDNENASKYVPCVTLRAYYDNEGLPVDDDGNVIGAKVLPDRFVDIEVIENSSIVDLRMNYQTVNNSEFVGDGKSFVLNKNDSGEYDVVLLNPDYKDGMIYDSYYIERDLMFDFKFDNQGEYNFNDYFIDTDTVLETANKPIVLSYSNIDNSFKVQAQKSGTHRQVFRLDHVQYPGIINSEIVVNFHVLDVPTGMTINDANVKDSYKIYDYYAASYGTRFNIDLNNTIGDFNYFVFTDNADYQEYFHIYKSDGVQQSLAVATENAYGKLEITSESYSKFRDRESFYLRHSFEEIPEDDVYIYVGIEYSVAAESYTDDIEDNYFVKDYVKFPIKLKFEQGIKDLYFTQNQYMLDVTDINIRDLDDNEGNKVDDYSGIKILDLPKGQTVQSLFETINYDRSLIRVYSMTDEVLGVTSLYVKVNTEFAVGQTDLEVITRNGLKKTVSIETFVPTMYAINMKKETQVVPLSINFDEQEVLYFENYSSDGVGDRKEQFVASYLEGENVLETEYKYNSPETMILAKNHYVDLQFLDYMIALDGNGGTIVKSIDVTENVSVSFSYTDYLTYNNGRLTAKKITTDIKNPVIMTVSYIGGYLAENEDGVLVYTTHQETRNIEVYIYNVLDGIKVSSPNEIELHLYDSLGYFDKGLATHSIKANYNPNSDDLGAQWNTNREWTLDVPVGLKYDIELNKYIYNTDGSIKIYSYHKEGVEQVRELKYEDLFAIEDDEKGGIVITSKLSEDFRNFLTGGDTLGREIDYDVVQSNLMKKGTITLPIIITARQFDRFQVVAQIDVNLVPATRIGQLVMDVESDGIYFEVGEGADNSEKSRTITYTTDTAHASNNRMFLINSTNSLYEATCTPSKITNGGRITINTLGGAGVEYLTIVPEDNIKDYEKFTGPNWKEGLFDSSLFSQIRIKVADGSEAYPYEVKSISDYDNMLGNISNNKFFHYYLTRNINLKDTSQNMVDIIPADNQYFSLNGAYSYYYNGTEYNVVSRLYNLAINTETSNNKNLNFGLFGNISGNVVIKNLSVMNARINITVDDENKINTPVNVGILAGSVGKNVQILNTQVYGNITIIDNLDSTDQQTINAGGMVGDSSNATIKGLPATYQTGIASTGYNANVSIDYFSRINSYTATEFVYNVGGLIGNDNHTTIQNLNIVSTIKGADYCGSIGGVVGNSISSNLDNVLAYPKITIKEKGQSQSQPSAINIGGLIGQSDSGSCIEDSKVYFIREDVTQWDSKVGIYVDTLSTANVGGLIGQVCKVENSKLSLAYSYVRSFYVGGIVEDSFHGDLYIKASGGTLGGLIGAGKKIEMNSSYFDADMTGAGVTIGAIMGSIDGSSKVQDAYAITDVYTISDGKLTEVIDNSVAMFGGLNFNESAIILGKTCTKSSNSLSLIDNTYSVVNDYIYYFGENNSVYTINGISKDGDTLIKKNLVDLGVSNLLWAFELLDYKIIEDSATATISSVNDKWLYNADANLAGGIALPILFNDHGGNQTLAKAMFDVVPEKIVIDRIGKVDGFYDISEGENTHVLMLVNTLDSKDNPPYQICVDNDSSAISIKFDGKTIVTRFIEINSEIIITENSNGSIISLNGAYITPVAEGTATITIRSALDKTVALNIDVTVIAKIKKVQLRVNEDNSYTSLEQGNPAQVYIDEGTYFKLFNVLNDQFVATNAYGYKIQLLGDQDSQGKININGENYEYVDGEENIIDITNTNLLIKGVSIGTIKLKITPYYKNLSFDSCASIEYWINVLARARSINIKEENLKFEVKSSANFNILVETSNVIIIEEKAYEKFGDKLNNIDDKDKTVYTIKLLQSLTMRVNSSEYVVCPLSGGELVLTNFVEDNGKYIINDNDIQLINGEYVINNFEQIIDHEIFNLTFSTIAIKLTDIDTASSRNTYRVVLSAKATFDMQYYRENANYFDLNTIEYSFAFKPNSNNTLSDSIAIGITPSKVTNIYTNYYSKGELLGDSANDGETYPQENESNFIIPGRSGLLKITLDQEFNDSSYMELVLSDAYKPYLTVSQMSGRLSDDSDKYDDPTLPITHYKPLKFQEYIEDGRYGIKLTKMSVNNEETSYFNNTYFVKFDLNRDYGNLQEISFQIISYTVGKTETTKLVRNFTYTVTQLPNVSVEVENSTSSVLGLGVKKELDITYSNITNDIHYNVGRTNAKGEFEIVSFDSKVYIADENGNNMNGTLKLEDLNNGKKYYLCADVTAELQKYSITFHVNEIVLGVKESATSTLAINLVDFEIDQVTVASAENKVLTLKNGQQYAFAVDIDYRDIVVGDPAAIEAYKSQLDATDGLVSMAEYAIAGTRVQMGDTSTSSQLRLFMQGIDKGEKIYTLMKTKTSYEHLYVTEGDLEDIETGIKFTYIVLEATSVTPENSPMKLMLKIPYEYTSDGHLLVDDELDVGNQTFEIEFDVVIEDNSTYDHPNPIDNAEELLGACKSGTGDYILVNNITLSNWIPQEASFDSLDGNGYVITIESFDLTSFRGSNTANIGIFTSIPENTLIKNITVDIGSLLVTEKEVMTAVENVRNSTVETYIYDNLIDISFTNTVNFGVIAAINNGSITNAKVVNLTKNTNTGAGSNSAMYMHIVTSQGFNGTQAVETNIGGIVAINEGTGAITNSFVGINSATASSNTSTEIKSTINVVRVNGDIHHNNRDDDLVIKDIYPFIIAGGNNIGGIVSQNSGIISNTYTKALGLFNTYPAVNNSKTAGFVATNDGKILSSFVESARNVHYRAIEDNFLIESTGNIGAFVFENNNLIENTYVDVFLETQSAFTGGFVFNNTENGFIRQSYTTAINKNSLAHGQFTGIASNGRDLLNQGTYENVYYILSREETENVNEDATAISFEDLISDADKKTIWRGFFFSTQVIEDGIWQLKDNSCPKIDISETISFRCISGITTYEQDKDGETITVEKYDYVYIQEQLGTQKNPLIIDKAENFDKYIIDMSVALGKDVTGDGVNDFAFGLDRPGNAISTLNTVSYVRLVNNLDFSDITTAVKHKGRYLYQTVFAGALDGNGMTLSNLNINIGASENGEESTVRQLDNFGLFAQIGVSSTANNTQEQAVIKNLNLSLSSYRTGEANKAGILAGTIVNSNIVNVRINANSSDETLMVTGKHLTGGLAGLIYADGTNDKVSIYDVTIENITLASTYGSLGGELTEESKDLSGGLYKSFSVKALESQTTVERSFVLYDDSKNNYNKVSYAGSVAGIIVANNTAKTISTSVDVNNFRTLEQSTIEKIIVKNHVLISNADNAGGLFGYVGKGTLIKGSKFILNGEQLIKADNFAGGIVAENHGIIEQCSIAFDDETQKEMDNSLALESRVTSDYMLFDTSSTSKNYSVAIGGIAGFSSNGVIIDSYAKVNVLKPTAYVAGGILGYSEGSNLIAYSYSTGAVYGQFVVGGIVGMQTSKKDNDDPPKVAEYLKMQNVIALTDWNYSSADYNYMNNITSKLYDNQKVLYANNGEYYNFYVKMPEIGNVGIIYQETETLDTEEYREKKKNQEAYYKDLHKANNFFVGSVVGKFIIEGSTEPIFDYTNDDYAGVISGSTNVFSNTLGRYSGTGNYNAGTRQDTYFADNSKFDYITATNNTVSLYSYRIAYLDSNSINAYQNITIDSTNTSAYFDVHNFPQLFTAQEYTQQIVGSYASIVELLNFKTSNLFKYDYLSDKANRYGYTYQKDSAWANGDKNYNTIIWSFDEILPTYNNGTYQSNITIDSETALKNAFKSLGTGLTYNIAQKDYNIELDENTTAIQYHNALRDVFNGIVKEDVGTRPKIIFTISNSITANTIFSALSGTTLNNLDIEIVINSIKNTNQYNENFGILANTVQNITMNNCNVTLTIGSNIVIGQAEDFQAHNFGALFGEVSASYFQGNNFVISAKTITILNNDNVEGNTTDFETLENIGLFAGYVDRTTMVGNTFKFAADIVIDNCDKSITNIGLVAGKARNSTYKNNTITNLNTSGNSISNNNSAQIVNAGGMFGFADNTIIQDISQHSTLLTFNLNESAEYNLSSIIGRSQSSRLNNIIVDDIINVNSAEKINVTNFGMIAGLAEAKTTIERSKVSKLDYSIIVDGEYSNLSVGGFVGYATSETEFNGNIFNSNLSVSNMAVGTKTADVYTNVGAMIGTSAKGSVYILNSYVAGNLQVVLPGENDIYMAGIGGFVGRADNPLELDCFASFVDFNINDGASVLNENTYVAGVVGINKSLILATNGYSYVQLPENNEKKNNRSITTQSISSNTQNVFYAQEFVGNDYASDSLFRSFAMADLYGDVNPYSDISILLNCGFKKAKIQGSEIYLLIPETLELESKFANFDDSVVDVNKTGSSRFDPESIGSDVSIGAGKYYVIENDITLTDTQSSNAGIISGKSTATGKVVVQVSNGSYLFDTNSDGGVISNIYLQTCSSLDRFSDDNKNIKSVSLVEENNGLITNVYVYGYTSAQYSIAYTNKDRIYQSASATIYFEDNDPNKVLYNLVYGLVKFNGDKGIIEDCYSGNFGITDNNAQVTQLYGLAYDNDGTISNSYYYVPEIIKYDNEFIGPVNKTESDHKIENYSTNPSFYTRRSAVWTTENGHLQIRGIKDIAGSIVIRPLINGKSIGTALDIRKLLINSDGDDNHNFTYQTEFYVPNNQLPKYSVVKIDSGSKFVQFINGRANNNLPVNTVVLLDFESQNVGKLKTLSVPTSSILIGLGAGATIVSNKVTYNSALINQMYGALANITLVNFVFNNESLTLEGFAPILYNNGAVYKVNFNNVTVNSGVASKVSVMIYDNKGSIVSCNVNTGTLIVRSATIFNGTLQEDNQEIFEELSICYRANFNGKTINCEVKEIKRKVEDPVVAV